MQHREKIAGHARRLGQNTKVRFIGAGIFNTLVDVACFNLLIVLFSVGVVPASIVSTTTAMAISYLINKKVVFRSQTPHSVRQIILFIAVTLTGIWLVQTLIMVQVLAFLDHAFAATEQSFLEWFLRNVAKGCGIVAAAVWSYFGYSRLVFRETRIKKD